MSGYTHEIESDERINREKRPEGVNTLDLLSPQIHISWFLSGFLFELHVAEVHNASSQLVHTHLLLEREAQDIKGFVWTHTHTHTYNTYTGNSTINRLIPIISRWSSRDVRSSFNTDLQSKHSGNYSSLADRNTLNSLSSGSSPSSMLSTTVTPWHTVWGLASAAEPLEDTYQDQRALKTIIICDTESASQCVLPGKIINSDRK